MRLVEDTLAIFFAKSFLFIFPIFIFPTILNIAS
jgi:hypothetical protein